MKKHISAIALTLAMALLLPGCAAMLERSHVSVTTHADYAVVEDDSVLRAETYQGLVNAILYLINEHLDSGSIRLHNYTGDVEADLAGAKDEVLHRDPIGAFAVRTLQFDSTRILTYYEVDVSITYAHTAREVEDIQPLSGVSGLRQELARMVAKRQEEAVFLISYFSGDAALVRDLLTLVWYGDPACLMDPGGPDCRVTLYPETGTRRIVEVRLRLPEHSQQAVDSHMQQLEETAAQLLDEFPPAGEDYTVEELAAIVRSAAGPYDGQGARLPLKALSGQPAADEGLLLAMEYLCQQAGVEASPVYGSEGLWLIVSTPDGYRHLLPQGLRPLAAPPEEDDPEQDEEPEEPLPLLYTDEELTAMGYTWPVALHPACVDTSPPSPEPTGDSAPEAQQEEQTQAPANP